ncbi:MAG: prefoldin subunit alpha [Thermoplasmata archaeon]|nr:prefoldin subunit alpha [Thermoplasmata archaeon]
MSENQLRQTISAIDVSRAQLDNVSRQQEVVRASIEENLRAKDTLANYVNAKEDEEILIPAGAGIFLHAKVGRNRSCIANIGAGVMMEKDIGDIKKLLDEQIEELKKAAQQLDEQGEKIGVAIEELSKDAREQYLAMQQPTKMKGK